MEKIVVHHFWLRGIRLWLLVFMCLFHISQSFAQIKFIYDKDLAEKLYMECDCVVIDGITYRFHHGTISICYDDAAHGELLEPTKFIIMGGYFTAENYNDDLCSDVVLYGSLSASASIPTPIPSDNNVFTMTFETKDGVWKYPFEDSEGGRDFTYQVRVAPDLFTDKEKLESVSGKIGRASCRERV